MGELRSAMRGGLRRLLPPLVLLALVASLGSYVVYRTTSHGVGLRDDSFSYLSGAEGLASGAGYARLGREGEAKAITNFPPGYSSLLAVVNLAGLALPAAARLVGGLSFSALVFLLAASALWATRSLPAALFAAIATLASPSLIGVLTWALSEGPYLALAASGLFALALYLHAPRRGYLLAGAALLALATLTRYVGITLSASASVLLALHSEGGRPERIRRAVGFLTVSLAPVVAFLIRNAWLAGSATNRPAPFWHPPDQAKILAGSQTVLGWLLPEQWLAAPAEWLWLPALILLLALVAVPLAFGRRRPDLAASVEGLSRARWLAWLHAGHALAYALFLGLSVSFLDRLTPLDDRILAPLQASAIVLVALGGWRLSLNRQLPGRALLAVLALAALGGQVNRGLDQIRRLEPEGLGFNSGLWRSSPTLEYVREEIPDVAIYSNNLPALYFLADRRAIFVPARYDPASDAAADDYEGALERYRRAVFEQSGRLVILGSSPRTRLPPQHLAELTEGLTLVAEFRDGLVYRRTE